MSQEVVQWKDGERIKMTRICEIKNILTGLQYLDFIKGKEAWYDYNFKVTPLDLDKWDEEIVGKDANRDIKEWIIQEIGWRLERIHEDISFFFRITLPEYFIRGKRGWTHSDTWGLDCYLSKVIQESVLHLKTITHGHPSNLKNMRQWKSILKKIAYTFEVAPTIGHEVNYIPSKDWTRKEYNKRKNQWKNCKDFRVMTKTESLKYEEGWRLFQEYFQNLWD